MFQVSLRRACALVARALIDSPRCNRRVYGLLTYEGTTRRCFSCYPQGHETLEVSKRRLMMRINNTGMKELDIVLSGYVSKQLKSMEMKDVHELHAILDIDTPVLYQVFILMTHMPEGLKDNAIALDLLKFVKEGMLAPEK